MSDQETKSIPFNRRQFIDRTYAKMVPLSGAVFFLVFVNGIFKRKERVLYHSLFAGTSTMVVSFSYFGVQEYFHQKYQKYTMVGNLAAGAFAGTLGTVHRIALGALVGSGFGAIFHQAHLTWIKYKMTLADRPLVEPVQTIKDKSPGKPRELSNFEQKLKKFARTLSFTFVGRGHWERIYQMEKEMEEKDKVSNQDK